MPRVCAVTGKRTRVGYQVTRRGLAKKKGGVGRKVTGHNKRTFKPNLQDVRVLTPNGSVVHMKLSTGVIKKGVITLTQNGRTVSYPLVRAIRGRQRAWQKQQAQLAQQAPKKG